MGMNVLNPDIDIESRWTQKEDDDLLKYHNEFGDKWALIARKLGTKRTDCYCRQRYKALMKKVKPRKKVDRKWRKTEDDLLKKLVFEHGKNNFLFIGSHFENRTALQCSSRWLKSTAPYIRSGEWDKMEDIQCVLSHNAYLPQSIPDIIYSADNRYHPSYKNP